MRPIATALVALLCCIGCDINARQDSRDTGAAPSADTGGTAPGQDVGVAPGADGGNTAGTDAGSTPRQDAGAAPGRDAGTVTGADAGAPLTGTLFPPGSVWYQDVSKAALDPKSAAVIKDLSDNGGWGNGNVMQVDFSFEVLFDDGSAPMRTFTKTDDFYDPDCDDGAGAGRRRARGRGRVRVHHRRRLPPARRADEHQEALRDVAGDED